MIIIFLEHVLHQSVSIHLFKPNGFPSIYFVYNCDRKHSKRDGLDYDFELVLILFVSVLWVAIGPPFYGALISMPTPYLQTEYLRIDGLYFSRPSWPDGWYYFPPNAEVINYALQLLMHIPNIWLCLIYSGSVAEMN